MTRVQPISAHSLDLSAPAEWLRLGVQGCSLADVADILGQVTKPARSERWGAFWATQCVDGCERAVGLCSFKTEPNSLLEVEIAYYTFPHREGRGVATAMVGELTRRALPHVARVLAHTLPTENASCSVLRRCGFERIGEGIYPDGGLVWRWCRVLGCRD